jgi:hypothetical protein
MKSKSIYLLSMVLLLSACGESSTKNHYEKPRDVLLTQVLDLEQNDAVDILSTNMVLRNPLVVEDSSSVKESEDELVSSIASDFTNVVGNLESNCNRISGKSWRCCGKFILYSDGTITGTINTSSNRWQGFTGAALLEFHDDRGLVIYQVQTPSYGVNGESSRSDQWSTTIPRDVVAITKSWSGVGVHTSSNRTIKQLTEEGVRALKQYLGSQ